jgi:hypothetical protein
MTTIVGTAGELEHSAALLHPSFGAPVRAGIGGRQGYYSRHQKGGEPGAPITLPLTSRDHIPVSCAASAIIFFICF